MTLLRRKRVRVRAGLFTCVVYVDRKTDEVYSGRFFGSYLGASLEACGYTVVQKRRRTGLSSGSRGKRRYDGPGVDDVFEAFTNSRGNGGGSGRSSGGGGWFDWLDF